ncbi:hypothetical protein JCM6882_007546 [Rhodosporidiobolus microsporus]
MPSFSPRLFTFVALFGLLAVANAAAILPRTWYRVLSTPHGDISGESSAMGTRYTVPYAKAPTGSLRFKDPVTIDTFSSYDASQLPDACPQMSATGPIGSEDCLFVTIYTPPSATKSSKLPVLAWVHGGSFVQGASSILDGAALAKSQNMVVVTIQYRLGALGWLKSYALGLDGNYGLKDIIQALKLVQTDISAFGGDSNKVTLAGQSSAAEIIKSLLVTPSATSLFTRAILQSAPLNTVDQSSTTANAVSTLFLSQDYLGCDTSSCLQNKSIEDLLTAQSWVMQDALGLQGQLDSDFAFSEPLRAVVDGSLVTRGFRQTVASGGQLEGPSKELIFTTVKDEGCTTIASIVPNTAAAEQAGFENLVGMAYPYQAASIISSGLYNPNNLVGADRIREQLLRLNSDFSWTCPNQQTAVRLTASNGFSSKIYLGEFDLGISYNGGAIDFCKGRVDHQDDIATLFSTPSGLSSAQKTLSAEVQARWGAFARTGSPNASGYTSWPTVSASTGDLNVLQLGVAAGGKSRVTKSQRDTECKVGSGLYTFV